MKKSLNVKNLIVTTPYKMKLGDFIGSLDSLNVLSSLNGTLMRTNEGLKFEIKEGLNVITQYKLIPLIKKCREEYDNFNKIRNDKIKEWGFEKKDENGEPNGIYQIKPENSQKLKDADKELLEAEIEVQKPSITYSELKGGNKKFSLPTQVLEDLFWLVEIDLENLEEDVEEDKSKKE